MHMGTHKYMTAPLLMETMPRGVPYIVGNEFAERFSFYGMKGILVVFMTQYLMRSSGELDLMSNEDATGYYHLFTSAVYFTPLLGALIADIFLGKYMTIISLSLVYCLGHFMLALDDTRFGLALGLGLIALGAGGIKPCVSAHVGDQFGSGNKHMLPKVYGWFYISINIGAFISNLLTPWLLNSPDFGPQWAFGIPGGLMLLATWVFWLGRRKFIHIQPSGLGFVKETLSGDGLVAIGKLSIIFVFVAMFWALFDQTGSTWVIQARSMDRTIWGYTLFEAQFQAANPLLILILVPIFTLVVYPAINTLIQLTPVRKIAIGMFLTVVAFTVPAIIETNIAGGRVFEASSQAARRTADGDWSAWNLIDGDPDGSGWATAGITRDKESGEDQVSGDEGGLGSVVIQLRERKAWVISGLAVNPFVRGVMNADDDAGEDNTAFPATDRFAKDITIFIGDRPAGPWSEVATIALEQTDEFQTVTFGAVEASYVKLRIDANWGGNHAAIGRVRVIAAAEFPPADAAATAASVWPDVAAIGYKPPIIWQLLAYILITAAEVMISITCLEFSYTQAPRKMKSFIMSFYLLSVSVGNLIVAGVNFFIRNDDGTSKLAGASYYWFFTALMLVTAVIFLVVAKLYREKTYIQQDAPAAESGGPGFGVQGSD